MMKRLLKKRAVTLLELAISIAVMGICAGSLLTIMSSLALKGEAAEFYNRAIPLAEGMMEEYVWARGYSNIVQVGSPPYGGVEYDSVRFPGYFFTIEIDPLNVNYNGDLDDNDADLLSMGIFTCNYIRARLRLWQGTATVPRRQIYLVAIVTPLRGWVYGD